MAADGMLSMFYWCELCVIGMFLVCFWCICRCNGGRCKLGKWFSVCDGYGQVSLAVGRHGRSGAGLRASRLVYRARDRYSRPISPFIPFSSILSIWICTRFVVHVYLHLFMTHHYYSSRCCWKPSLWWTFALNCYPFSEPHQVPLNFMRDVYWHNNWYKNSYLFECRRRINELFRMCTLKIQTHIFCLSLFNGLNMWWCFSITCSNFDK